jgi:N-acetylmuramoyl-L-alanine amidase
MHDSLTEDNQTVSWGAIRKYHMNVKGWSNVGYQFGVELIGDHYEILLGRMVGEVGAHCLGYNDKSIGICLIGNFDQDKVPQDQWDVAVKLAAHYMWLFGIPTDNIGGHREFDPNRTCPHKWFNCSKFRTDVTATVATLQKQGTKRNM